MAERIDTLPADDRYVVWVCPTHGIIDEHELLEGVDWDNPNPDGDIYTDEFFCGRKHAPDNDARAVLLDLKTDIAAALGVSVQEGENA